MFPRLELIEFIGIAGIGAVYKAWQPELGRFVALKILPVLDSEGKASAERFARQARALARLQHPNIVTIYDLTVVNGLIFFMVEYVDGPNLRQLQKGGTLSPRTALHLVLQICEALQFAHEAGQVHRDIKPENTLVDKKGQVKISDFGILKIINAQKPGAHYKGVIRALDYVAPEGLTRPWKRDHRGDIYALGVVFYEMLTGELPRSNLKTTLRLIRADVRLDEIILRALEKRPDQRYQHVREIRMDLEKVRSTSFWAKKEGECG